MLEQSRRTYRNHARPYESLERVNVRKCHFIYDLHMSPKDTLHALTGKSPQGHLQHLQRRPVAVQVAVDVVAAGMVGRPDTALVLQQVADPHQLEHLVAVRWAVAVRARLEELALLQSTGRPVAASSTSLWEIQCYYPLAVCSGDRLDHSSLEEALVEAVRVVLVVAAEGTHCRSGLEQADEVALEGMIVCCRWVIHSHLLRALGGCHCSVCECYSV